jgi:hypothetical protein
MKPLPLVVAIGAAAVLTLSVTATGPAAHVPQPASRPSAGIGGAGALIPPAHVNGPFGAGGPWAAIGGAGAFIPTSDVFSRLRAQLEASGSVTGR